MPVPLEAGDRRILIVAGALLLILLIGALLLSPPGQKARGFPSSYSAASDGAKAAFLVLKELGYRVERWESPAPDLPSESAGTVLVLAEPFLPPARTERHAVRAFLRRGGRVLATAGTGAIFLPQGNARRPTPPEPGFKWKRYRAALPSPLTRGAPEITLAWPARWKTKDSSHLGVYGSGEHTVVVTYRVGQGRVIWWGASSPLTNAGLTKPGNLALLLNSLGPPAETRILWDEYYHGQRGSLWSYFSGTPVTWALTQIALVFLAVCLTFARRSGPVRRPLPESRLSPLEFVETLGDLYRRGHASSAAVEIGYHRFRFLATKGMGLPVAASTGQIAESLQQRLGWNDPGLLKTLQRCESARLHPDLTDADATHLVQALHDYARALQLTPQKREEGL
ncbi:MAG: DUF4350 domain-containing protein [Terriglobia bacterium]